MGPLFDITHITSTFIAISGGVAKYLARYLKGEEDVVSFAKLGANAVVSAFSGYMVAQTVTIVNPEWILVAAGIGGYMGTEALDFLIKLGKGKIKNGVSK